MIPYKSREIPGEFYYQVEKFIKKAQKIARILRIIENGMKILEICWEKSTGICIQMPRSSRFEEWFPLGR